MKKLGLYIHIPFCSSKCGYCDFFSARHSEKVMDQYLTALLMHVREYGDTPLIGYEIDSIFIGGGTPSFFGERRILSLIKEIYKTMNVTRDCEFTVEVNPNSADASLFRGLRKAGVNRLSIGLQSCIDTELTLLGRTHSFHDFSVCYENARRAKFDNISIDLMYGIPSQDLKSFAHSLDTVIRLAPAHVSLYGLKIEDGTPFAAKKTILALPEEEEERRMYFLAISKLEDYGLYQYEISNFSRDGRQCRHNTKYWNCEEYIGLGPAAHSYFCGSRYSYKGDLELYITSFTKDALESADYDIYKSGGIYDDYFEISPKEQINEYVMLRLRLTEGVNTADFKSRFGVDFDSIFLEELKPFIKSTHVVKTKHGYAFSPEGMYVSNYILSRVLSFNL